MNVIQLLEEVFTMLGGSSIQKRLAGAEMFPFERRGGEK